MRKTILIVLLFLTKISFSQRIYNEQDFSFENMCDEINDSISKAYKTQTRNTIDSLAYPKIIESTRQFVKEISKTRFTYPYRRIIKNYLDGVSQTELLYAFSHFNISDENINSGFAEQYPYFIYDSIMYDAITSRLGENIFKIIKTKSDSLKKVGKGYNSAKFLGKQKLTNTLKYIFKGASIKKIECRSMDMLSLTIDSNGKCVEINLLQLGWHGTTNPSNCEKLKRMLIDKKEELEKLKWKPAEFEGHPMKRTISISVQEFVN